MNIEAMKQALEALELTDNDAVYGLYRDEKRQVIEAITSLRQAIAEAEKQESDDLTVAYMSGLHDGKKQRQQERNFCERCGKRLFTDHIHTCTPPAEKQETAADDFYRMIANRNPNPFDPPQRQQEAEKQELVKPQNCGTSFCSCIECVMEQEPVAWLYLEPNNPHKRVHHDNVDVSQFPHDEWFPVYTSPPQRQWVGLTDKEKEEIETGKFKKHLSLIDAIEAKLKEKNT